MTLPCISAPRSAFRRRRRPHSRAAAKGTAIEWRQSRVLRALEVVRAAPNETTPARRRASDHRLLVAHRLRRARQLRRGFHQHLARGTDAALRVKNELDRIEKLGDIDAGAAKMTELAGELRSRRPRDRRSAGQLTSLRGGCVIDAPHVRDVTSTARSLLRRTENLTHCF